MHSSRHPNAKYTSRIVNLTDQILSTYDQDTGDIIPLEPEDELLPLRPTVEPYADGPEVYYVINSKAFKRIKNYRPLDDIAVVKYQVPGRGNAIVSYFMWGKDPQTEVYFGSH